MAESYQTTSGTLNSASRWKRGSAPRNLGNVFGRSHFGQSGGFFSKSKLDKKFDKGSWGESKRRLLRQSANEKWRAIDNARSSKNNAAADQWVTLTTPSLDLAMKVAIRLAEVCTCKLEDLWQLVMGAEDMENAYRSIPNAPEHLPYCVIAVYDPKQYCTKFMISWALLFGQSAALNGFNRVPALIASAACRLLASMTWHYFDDYAVLDVERHATSNYSSQVSLRELSNIIGFAVSPAKSKNPSREQVTLEFITIWAICTKAFYLWFPRISECPGLLSNCSLTFRMITSTKSKLRR